MKARRELPGLCLLLLPVLGRAQDKAAIDPSNYTNIAPGEPGGAQYCAKVNGLRQSSGAHWRFWEKSAPEPASDLPVEVCVFPWSGRGAGRIFELRYDGGAKVKYWYSGDVKDAQLSRPMDSPYPAPHPAGTPEAKWDHIDVAVTAAREDDASRKIKVTVAESRMSGGESSCSPSRLRVRSEGDERALFDTEGGPEQVYLPPFADDDASCLSGALLRRGAPVAAPGR